VRGGFNGKKALWESHSCDHGDGRSSIDCFLVVKRKGNGWTATEHGRSSITPHRRKRRNPRSKFEKNPPSEKRGENTLSMEKKEEGSSLRSFKFKKERAGISGKKGEEESGGWEAGFNQPVWLVGGGTSMKKLPSAGKREKVFEFLERRDLPREREGTQTVREGSKRKRGFSITQNQAKHSQGLPALLLFVRQGKENEMATKGKRKAGEPRLSLRKT